MLLNRPLIELDSVSKTFTGHSGPVKVLSDVRLVLDPGQRLCVIGASGSGKSSLLELMGTLARPDTGRVLFDGQDLASIAESDRIRIRRHRIGFVFQNAHLIDYLDARENVALPLRYQRIGRRARARAAQAWLDRVGLSRQADTPVSRLSGGERQRVAFARAMVTDPDLVLADEPTGSLDQGTGAQVLDQMLALADRGKALVLVTHNLDHARHFDSVLTMARGKVSDATHASPAACA